MIGGAIDRLSATCVVKVSKADKEYEIAEKKNMECLELFTASFSQTVLTVTNVCLNIKKVMMLEVEQNLVLKGKIVMISLVNLVRSNI